MDPAERTELIAVYRSGVAAVQRALEGITDAELDREPPDGGWTGRMVVHHLADSETNSYIRLRKLLAEDDTQIQGYEEPTWARLLHYDRPIATSMDVFEAVRASSGELLDHLAGGDWTRTGTHSERGAYSVEDWLRIYAAHAHEHAHQIRRARGFETE